jgi:hypothetical protein
MSQSVYVVYPGAWLGWDVVREGSAQDFSFEDQHAALAHAFHMARLFAPAKVVLEDARGAIQAQWHVDPAMADARVPAAH